MTATGRQQSESEIESQSRSIQNGEKSESSTQQSQLASEHAMTSSTAPLKTYGFYYTKRHIHLKVCDEEKNVIYFSNFSSFSSAPDLVLHRGPDKNAPVAAVAIFRWARDIKLGFGDPDLSEREMIWENMKNVSRGLGHSKYRVEMTVKDERRSFLWQRTRDTVDGVHGAGKLTNWNYKLVDETTGDVVAVYLENFMKSWNKKGRLQLRADLGTNWELMVLLGSLALCEKAGRRQRHRYNANGGGG